MFPASIRGGDDGFTLLELLVVLAIVSMVLVSAPTLYSKLIPSYQVRQSANDLANEARRLRERARNTGAVQQIEIDEELNLITVNGSAFSAPDIARVSFAPAEGYGAGPDDLVRFYPNGASSGGRIGLSYKSLVVEVAFDWVSGAVEVSQ